MQFQPDQNNPQTMQIQPASAAAPHKIGWIIAGVMVAAVLAILGYLIISPSPSPRTTATADPNLLEIKQVDASVKLVLGFVPSAPGNAADNYNLAIKAMKSKMDSEVSSYNRDDLGLQAKYGGLPVKTVKTLEIIARHVRAGAKKAAMNYIFTYTPDEFKVGFYTQAAADLGAISATLELLAAAHLKEKKYAAAEQAIKSRFTLGWHMMNERKRLDVLIHSLNIQDSAILALKSLYGQWPDHWDANRNKKLDEYSTDLIKVKQACTDKLVIVWSTQPKPGDVFYIIENDRDLAWRVQGLLSLGIVKFIAANSRGDINAVNRIIAKYSGGDDPYLRAAAKAADEFTRAQFNQIGSQF